MQSVGEVLNLINSKLADFNDAEAIQAFNQLKDFIADNNSTAEEISDAYLLQGLLVAVNPFLTGCENDYSGIVYFHESNKRLLKQYAKYYNYLKSKGAKFAPFD